MKPGVVAESEFPAQVKDKSVTKEQPSSVCRSCHGSRR